VLLEDQMTARSVTTTSFASRTMAESDVTCVDTSVTDAGDTATLPTGTATTVTLALPLLPPLVATIEADPGATAVTRPVANTVATVGLLEGQLTVRSVSSAPLASFTVGTSDTLSPTTSDALLGATVMLATGGGCTVSVAMADTPPALAAI
jgi:hypothetical protein